MKRSSVASRLVYVVLLIAVWDTGTAAKAAVNRANLTSQQAADVHTAWQNLNRAYLDLLSTPADIKGDTSRLEGALKASIEDLHQLDESVAPPQPTGPPQDKGQSRDRIFKAVQDHLDLAKKALQESKINNSACKEALTQIAVAQGELTADKTAPVKK